VGGGKVAVTAKLVGLHEESASQEVIDLTAGLADEVADGKIASIAVSVTYRDGTWNSMWAYNGGDDVARLFGGVYLMLCRLRESIDTSV
jgi:hypothetical protein